MNPKLPLDGRIYTLTVGSVLTTNVSQISLCQLLFRATLKVRLDSCLSLLLEWTTLTALHISKKFTACLLEAVADLGGVRGMQMHPLWRLVMYFAYITARVHQMIMQQWHAATTTRHSYTLTYQFFTDLQTFD